MNAYQHVTVAAVAILPGPAGTVTFVAQRRGPLAGNWLLPGGRVELGESVPDAARRESFEECGCVLGDIDLTGAYEVRGRWERGPYHLITFAFLARRPVALSRWETGDQGVGAVIQAVPHSAWLHPIVMRVLHDAGIAAPDLTGIDRVLAARGISMLCLRAGSSALTGCAADAQSTRAPVPPSSGRAAAVSQPRARRAS